ncbi:hypothetical protein E3U43_014105 [Larimichthys crocea]|uniref:Uncharacterized protein n=1 Tax=Larimichthys crocea TaxID=215358 RepID=A0ACD3RBW2_LARCR|nr:hypothetical protein E3U43_014105 [Larimichthys crocea]
MVLNSPLYMHPNLMSTPSVRDKALTAHPSQESSKLYRAHEEIQHGKQVCFGPTGPPGQSGNRREELPSEEWCHLALRRCQVVPVESIREPPPDGLWRTFQQEIKVLEYPQTERLTPATSPALEDRHGMDPTGCSSRREV